MFDRCSLEPNMTDKAILKSFLQWVFYVSGKCLTFSKKLESDNDGIDKDDGKKSSEDICIYKKENKVIDAFWPMRARQFQLECRHSSEIYNSAPWWSS